MDNLRIFQNGTEYSAATINRPSVSWIKDTDKVVYDPYIPPYKLKVKYSDNTSYNKICDSSTALTEYDVRGGTGAYSAITDAEIGDCVISINDAHGTFNGCTSLSSVTIPNSVTTIGKSAFSNCTSLSSIDIPNSVTTIGYNAFFNCTSLSSIDIPNSVTSIDYSAFYRCTSLSSCTIGSGVTSIAPHTFDSCSGLTTIDIPSGVTSIDNGAFNRCSSLTSVTIPNTVTSIGGGSGIEDGTFGYCTSLSSITIPNSVTSIGGGAFRNSSLESITIPSGVTTLGNLIANCGSLTSVTVDSNNVVYDSRNNCNAIIQTSTNQLKYGCKTTVIPDTVTSIGEDAFREVQFTDINIPNSVTNIGNGAFYRCRSLTSIELPSGVTSIGSYAFYDCNLSAITVNATTPPTLGEDAFGNTNNCPIYVPSESVSAYQSSWSAYSSRIQAIPSPTPTAFTWTTIDDTFVGEQTPIPVYEIHINWATTDDASETFGFWDNPSFTGNGNYSCTINFDENSGLYELEIQQYPNWTTVYSHSYSSSTDINIDFIDVFGKPMYFNSTPLEYGDCIREECMQYSCNQYECDDWDSETGECIHEYCAEEGPCIDSQCMEYQTIYISTAKIEQTS